MSISWRVRRANRRAPCVVIVCLLLTGIRTFAVPPLFLDWGQIDTEASDQQARFASLRATSAPTPLQRLSSRGTAPWLVQFNDVVREEWKTQLAATGARIKGYMPENGFLVDATPAQIAAISAFSNVMWVSEFKAEYKRSKPLRELLADGDTSSRTYTIVLLNTGDTSRIATELETLTGKAALQQAEIPDGGLIRAELSPAQAEAISAWSEVQWIEPYTRPRLWNDVSVGPTMMNVSNVWTTLGLTGSGQIIAVADTGLDTGNTNTLHQDFSGRVTGFGWSNGAYSASYSWADTDAHGTHVSGSVLGNGTMSTGRYKGVSYAAKLIIQGTQADLGGLPTSLASLFNQAFTNGARIHSNSWGYDDHGYYNTDSRAVDQYVWSNRTLLIVIASGNSGADTNPANGLVDSMSVASPATAKNCLTVGASENYRTSGGYSTIYTYGTAWSSDYPSNPISGDYISRPYSNNIQGLAAFSGRGPCNDGRIKPDIVAPGTDIVSTRSRRATDTGWGVLSGNTNYLFEGGTSMATPLTAGAAGLLRQWVTTTGGITNPSAALLKALLLNGARNMAPGQYGTASQQEIPNARPNNAEGWGHVDLFNTLQPGTNFLLSLYDTNSLSTGGTNTFEITLYTATTNRCVLTMAYADYWGTAGSGKQLVNDLDLTVQKPSGSFLYANGSTSADATNNVETIEFVPDEIGTYTVRVNGRTVPSGGSQPYALVILSPVTIATPAAPTFTPLGIQTAVTAVATSFTVNVSGYPTPTLSLASSTASGGYNFIPASGLLSYTPPYADAGTKTFTFVATNTLGIATQTVTVAVALAAPSAPAAIWASETNETDFTAAWPATDGATGYRLDVHSSPSFSSTIPGAAGFEGFSGAGASNSSYQTRIWTNNGIVWTAYRARTDYTISGQALSLQNTSGAYFVSDVITGGIDSLSLAHRRSSGSATAFDIFVNTTKVASAISLSTSITTTKLTGINISGGFTIMVTNSGGNVARFDSLTWSNTPSTGGVFVAGYSNRAVAGTSQVVTGLTGNSTYFMRVRATNAAGTSANSPDSNVTTRLTVIDSAPGFEPVGTFTATVGVSKIISVSATGSPSPAIALADTTASTGYTFVAGSGELTYTPPASDIGAQTFAFIATNRAGSATQTVSVTVVAGPVYIPTVNITGIGTNSFTAEWTAVTDATNYQVQVATDTNFTTGTSGGTVQVATNAATSSVAPTGWTYDISSSSSSYLILGYSTNYVLSPFFSTEGLSTLAITIKARTYGGVYAATNQITMSISTDGGTNWTDVGTITPTNNSLSFYPSVDASAFVGYPNVCVKWAARGAGANRGAGIQSLSVSGTESVSGGSLVADDIVSTLFDNISGLAIETLYYVRVRALGGPWSDIVSASTLGENPSAPIFTSDEGPYSATAGLEISFNVSAGGLPTPTLNLAAATATGGSYSFAPESGTFVYTPPTNDVGSQSFTFTASNSAGVATQAISVVVSQATPPAFAPLGSFSATTGVALAFTVSTTNGNPTPVLALQNTTASSGYNFTPDTGRLAYTPTTNDVGTRTFTFTASNVAGIATQTVSVTVSQAPATAPTIDPFPALSTVAGVAMSYTVTATDPDSSFVTFKCTSAVSAATWSFNTNSGLFSFTPTTNQIGTQVFTFTARDDSNLVSSPSNMQVVVNAAADQVAVSFGQARVVAEEGGAAVALPVKLAYSGSAVVQVRFNGATNGSARWGTDFNCATTLVVSGSSSSNLIIDIVDDTLVEGPEAVTVSLVPISPATAGSVTQATFVVRDNDSLSILSGNITSGNDQSYQDAGNRILETLSPDIALLQEFNMTNSAGTNAYRTWVNDHFGSNFNYYVETESSDNIPNGIVSRWPILSSGEWTDTQLSDRDFAWATLDLPGTQVLHVISVHLKASSGYESTRTAQARALTNYIASAGWLTNGYVVIGGDFNLGSRSETALAVFTNKIFSDQHQPADQNGNKNTNSGRDNPYDLVLPSTNLDAAHRTFALAGYAYSNGIVFDTRLTWTNGVPPPALAADSDAVNMQHMAVMKIFALEADTSTPILAAPQALSATPAGISQIDVSFTANVSNQSVVIAWNTNGTFSAPSGTVPAAGGSLAGGAVLYSGGASPQSHTGLSACATYYYKAWSFNGTNYSSTGLTAQATTLGPSAPMSVWVSATNDTNFTANWSASAGASRYLLDVWIGTNQFLAGYSNRTVTSTNQLVTNVIAGATHSFRMRAAANTCESTSSATTSVYIRAMQSIVFASIPDQFTTSHVALAATASSGLPVSFSVANGPDTISGGTNLTFTATGSVTIVASQAGNASYSPAPSVTNQFLVNKSTALVTLDDLTQLYDGTTKAVRATTAPTGLTVAITYNGSSTTPVNAGTYAVTGVVNDALYEGSATDILTIERAEAGVYFDGLQQTYDGTPRTVIVTTDPSGLVVTLRYNDATNAPVNAGSYTVSATVVAVNYQGSSTGLLVVGQATQTITFAAIPDQIATNVIGLAATADSGLPINFAVIEGPATISAISNLSFTGTGFVQIAAAQPGDSNWLAADDVTNSFNLSKATAILYFNDLLQTYNGSNKSVSVVTDPTGLLVQVSYDATPIDVGAYFVSALIDEPLFDGAATGTLVIARASPILTWDTPADLMYGAALDESQLNATSSVPGELLYTPGTGTVLNAGSNELTVAFTPADTSNWELAAATVVVFVARAPQSIDFPAIGPQFVTNVVTLSATADSGLPVTFVVEAGPGVITNDLYLSFIASGEVVLLAAQDGDTNWLAAPTVTQLVAVASFADGNTNGISDEWELEHFGNLGTATATSDFDGDGQTDWGEFVAATDPTNQLSYQHIEIIGFSTNTFVVRFDTATGRIYRIDCSSFMTPPDWLPLFTNIEGTGLPLELNDTNNIPVRFYRQAVELRP